MRPCSHPITINRLAKMLFHLPTQRNKFVQKLLWSFPLRVKVPTADSTDSTDGTDSTATTTTTVTVKRAKISKKFLRKLASLLPNRLALVCCLDMAALVWTCLVLHPATAWQHMLPLSLLMLKLPACCGVRLRENRGAHASLLLGASAP